MGRFDIAAMIRLPSAEASHGSGSVSSDSLPVSLRHPSSYASTVKIREVSAATRSVRCSFAL